METLDRMHKEQRYKQMVIYVEACEAGSMFHSLLPQNMGGKFCVDNTIWLLNVYK